MSYRQLTREQRYQIHILIKEGYNQTQIALLLGFDKSTISRELRRNCGAHGYFPNQAHGMAPPPSRHNTCPRGPPWCPRTVSHERIYLYVYADKRRGGLLHRHLRSQKKQRKRYGGYIRRGQIPNRIGIEQRPAIVASKRRFGDWEADTIIGAKHQGGILSLVERKSKLTRLHKLQTKAASEVKDRTIALL